MSAREAAASVAAKLAGAGHRALFAGGCVRDHLLGLQPTDYDVATSATPEEIRAVFPKARGVGEAFGVMLVRYGGHTIEVATFRSDGPYHDGRRPSDVCFADERQDARRRDFTINGLFQEPETGTIIDYVGGQEDIRARRLRAIGKPDERLAEDRLRTLRAVRFAARFALEIEPETLQAVRAFAPALTGVSRERIGHEARRMLAHPARARAVELCETLGLAPVMLEEPPCGGEGMALDLTILRGLPPEAAVPTGLAAWMLGRGGEGPTHQRLMRWRNALLLSNEETTALDQALALRARVLSSWSGGDAATRKRIAAHRGFPAALQLLRAVHPALADEVAHEVEHLAQTGLAPPPFVTGDDLVRLGLSPGPAFKGLLERLYDRQLNGELVEREQALAAAVELAGQMRDA